MLNFEVYSTEIAQRDFENLNKDKLQTWNTIIDSNYEDLRNSIIAIWNKIDERMDLNNLTSKKKYKLDLLLGLEIHELLSQEPYRLTNRQLGDDSIWRYLNMKVVPEILYYRWGLKAPERFYRESRRLYLKSIYWYVELSWAGTKAATYEILKDNDIDVIHNLVERPGLGYDRKLYREIMRQNALYNEESRLVFRQVMKLNTLRLKTIAPSLYDGGIERYVENLFFVVSKNVN